ncbi:MAG: hypothetical protein KA715_03370 [Xanthomonadaceae bacterium]|nr:hypothetical protein [Xanthomonadaceae bacterium]
MNKTVYVLSLAVLMFSQAGLAKPLNVQSKSQRYFIHIAEISKNSKAKKMCLYKGMLTLDSMADMKSSKPYHVHYLPYEMLHQTNFNYIKTLISYVAKYGLMDVEEMQVAQSNLVYDEESRKADKNSGINQTLSEDQYKALESIFSKYESDHLKSKKDIGTCPNSFPQKK